MEEYSEYARVFKALGDPKRAMIADMLSRGELCACMILEKFDMSQSTLSHHMKILCECGLVKSREKGKWTYYSLDAETVGRIKQFLNDITIKNENCICKEDAGCCEGSDENE
ncbi:MAG: winged helix-turn-helix transcriptional regulator [Hungateiclostridium thermocellum]|nr:winged helix-turn-helix transcriptional regulator [Acetivibrio thermocellus]